VEDLSAVQTAVNKLGSEIHTAIEERDFMDIDQFPLEVQAGSSAAPGSRRRTPQQDQSANGNEQHSISSTMSLPPQLRMTLQIYQPTSSLQFKSSLRM
jgi:hypothetical protein